MKYLTSTKACRFFQFCGNAWSPTIDGDLFMYRFTTKGVQFPVFRQGFTCIISLSPYLHLMGSCFLIVTGPSVLMRKKDRIYTQQQRMFDVLCQLWWSCNKFVPDFDVWWIGLMVEVFLLYDALLCFVMINVSQGLRE